MIGGGADDWQAEGDVDRVLEVQRLDRNQRLVVIHAKRGVIVGAGRGVEQGVGRVGAADSPALGCQRGDRRLDNLDLFLAKRATLTTVGIETSHREARLSKPEIALQAAQHGAAARFDQAAGQSADDCAEREMSGDRHRPQRRPGEHHGDIGGGDATTLGDKFSLAGVSEADRVELFLGDRPGDHRRDRSRSSEADGEFEAVERAMRPGYARMAGQVRRSGGNLQQRQAEVEGRVTLARIVDHGDRPVPHGSERMAVANRDERRQVEC